MQLFAIKQTKILQTYPTRNNPTTTIFVPFLVNLVIAILATTMGLPIHGCSHTLC
jgi:hypothetical protein